MVLQKAHLLFHTVRYLRISQIIARFYFRLYKAKPNLKPAPPLREMGNWIPPIPNPVSLKKKWLFSFLNEEHQCKFPGDWNGESFEKLWLYNLHYFDDLGCVEADKRVKLHEQFIQQWLQDNPPGAGNGWEPYPVSLRIVNWIKWSLVNNSTDEMNHSLAVQVRFLSKRLEYHLLGNHLFTNGKALIYAGLFFYGDEAEEWLNKGLEIITSELAEQVLADGGHFERSPMYHAIILEDLLDLINLYQTYDFSAPEYWIVIVNKMVCWLRRMSHPDGDIVLFNDAAFGIAARPQELFDYYNRLKLDVVDDEEAGLNHFEETGYISWKQNDIAAFLDVAPIGPDYLPGHAHADTLNFELSLFGRRVFVDGGTSCYGISKERLRQRSTAAHNSVTLDGENSSEVWSGFRVARRARPINLKVESNGETATICCCHTGYHRLSGCPTHCRVWKFSDCAMSITDVITGEFQEAVGRFHIHPGIETIINQDGQSGLFIINRKHEIHWKVTGGIVTITETSYHPEFGINIPIQCMEVMFNGNESSIQMWW